MRVETILEHSPKVLTEEQRLFYFKNGYLQLENFISRDWLDKLWKVTEEFIEISKGKSESDEVFDLEPNHAPDEPRLRRLSFPAGQHEVYKDFAFNGPIVDLAEDLVGPSVKYHHSKLNFKWADGGEEVKWHQDIQFWPHTNYSPLTIGLYMNDVDDEMGPMGVIPGSHKGEIFDLYGNDGSWGGFIKETDLGRVDLDKVAWLKGPAGSITIHNCRMIHGSMANKSTRSRPLLLHTYSSGDALTLSGAGTTGPMCSSLIRGDAPRWVHFDEDPCLIPPDWSKGYTSIFALQQQEGLE